MEFALMAEPQFGMTYPELRDAARFAETIGLPVFARSDHYEAPELEAPHATDAFATLAGLARDTERIGLCVLVSPITFRHPGVIAKLAATIDEMSNGRMILGIGTGWMAEEHELLGLEFPDLDERFLRLEEALAYLRAAFGGGGFTGAHYRLAERPLRPRPTGPLPIVVGGQGPVRTPRLAGTYADEFNVFDRDGEIASKVEAARRAALAAGRDPSRLLISVMGGAVVGKDDAEYRRNLERVAALDPFKRTPAQIEDGLRRRRLPAGPASRAAEAMAALAEAGVGRYYVQHLGSIDQKLLSETFDLLRS